MGLDLDVFRASTHLRNSVCPGQYHNPDLVRPHFPLGRITQGVLDCGSFYHPMGSRQCNRSIDAMHSGFSFLGPGDPRPLHQSK